jgi:hypothetical protein
LTGRITPETTLDEDDFRNDYFPRRPQGAGL